MRIAIGSDHAGYALKSHLVEWLSSMGYPLNDHGTASAESVDYPDFASKVCGDILDGGAETGLLICNTGLGMSMSANKFPGIRAALCSFPLMAEYARRHNDANVLVLGGGYTAPYLAERICQVFLETGFDGGRHERRVRKIEECGRN